MALCIHSACELSSTGAALVVKNLTHNPRRCATDMSLAAFTCTSTRGPVLTTCTANVWPLRLRLSGAPGSAFAPRRTVPQRSSLRIEQPFHCNVLLVGGIFSPRPSALRDALLPGRPAVHHPRTGLPHCLHLRGRHRLSTLSWWVLPCVFRTATRDVDIRP